MSVSPAWPTCALSVWAQKGAHFASKSYSQEVSTRLKLVPTASASLKASAGLVPGEVAALQLALPFTLPAWLHDWLQSDRLVGAGLHLVVESALASPHQLESVQHLDAYGVRYGRRSQTCLSIHLFEGQRLMDEVLLFAPGRELSMLGWFAVGGCGRGGRELYVVNVAASIDEPPGGLYVWSPECQHPQSLGVKLVELGQRSTPASTQLRRRLPGSVLSSRPPTRAPTRRKRSRKPSKLSAAERTLSLFS